MAMSARRAVSEKRLSELGTGNWNNRGIDSHIKRPAGSSSAALKRMGMKRIETVPNTSYRLEDSLKYPRHCLVDNEYFYDGHSINHVPAWPREYEHHAAGVESVRTVHLHNHGALADKERDGPEGGKVPTWLIGAQTKRRVDAPYQHDHDPVQHKFVQPHFAGCRPMRRTGFQHSANRQNWVMDDQQKNTGPLKMHQISNTREWKEVAGHVHVGCNGEVLYNICGAEDLKPVGHKEFVKGDRPATAMQQYENDKRLLPMFERERPNTKGANPQLEESYDMRHILYGQADDKRSNADGYSVRSGSTWAEKSNRPQARSPRQLETSDRGNRKNGQVPRSARGSDAQSIRSSYYSGASEGRRSKSVDRTPRPRQSDTGSLKTPRSGVFSDPSRTVSVNALTHALKNMSSQSPRKQR